MLIILSVRELSEQMVIILLNTILGFCVALLVGNVVLKTVITAGEVGLLIHRGGSSAVGR